MVNDWVSINWYRHHRRSAELGGALGAEVHFVRSERGQLALRYLDQWRATRKLLRGRAPQIIQVMQPPVVALACIATSWRLRSSILVGDLHTGVVSDPKWKWASWLVLGTLRRRGFAIVPNEELAEICRRSGVETFVSHGFISSIEATDIQRVDGHILAPLTYAFDEPVNAILGAAARLPYRRFVLTGDAPLSVRQSAPMNVHFPGFVSTEDYTRLRAEAGLVLALTEQEMTMQSAGYEALADATPLITSPRRVLRHFFGDAACYAESDSESIASAIESVYSDHAGACARITRRREEQIRAQGDAIAAIKARVAQTSSKCDRNQR